MMLSPAWNNVSATTGKGRPPGSIIEDVEAASWNKRRHVSARKAQAGVGAGDGIGQPVGFIAVGIDRV